MKQILTFFLLLLSSAVAWAQPTITNIAPASAAVGSDVIITGTNFDTPFGNNRVWFGGTRATITAGDATSLTVTVPVGLESKTIVRVLKTSTKLIAESDKVFNLTFPVKPLATTNYEAVVSYAGLPTNGSPGMAVGDLDGDGKPEMVIGSNIIAQLDLYTNASTPGGISFANVSLSTAYKVTGVRFADFNGDGKLDIICSTMPGAANPPLILYENTSSGIGSFTFGTAVVLTAPTGGADFLNDVEVADLDGNGKIDIICNNQVGSSATRISVFRNIYTSGAIVAGSFSLVSFAGQGTQGQQMDVGDVTNDGKPDIVTGDNGATISVYNNTSTPGTVSFATFTTLTTTGTSYSIAVADFDGDGLNDIAASTQTPNVQIFRNTNTVAGTLSFAGSPVLTLSGMAGANPFLYAADVDGDGKQDLIFSSATTYVRIYRNTSSGVGNFAFATSIDMPRSSGSGTAVALIDADVDGFPDLAMANTPSGSLGIQRYKPDYYSRASGNWNSPSTWSSSCGGAASATVPTATDNVFICNGHTVTLTANATCNDLTINAGGTLKPASFNFTANGDTDISGTFLDDTSGGTNIFAGTLTVNSGGIFSNTAAGSVFEFRGNIAHSGTTFDIPFIDYYFSTNPITILANSVMNFGSSGNGAGYVNLNVTVLESPATVTFDALNGLTVANTRVFRNQNQTQGNHTLVNCNLLGTGTVINDANAVLLYGGGLLPIASGIFDVTAAGNLFGYYGSSQSVRATVYQNIDFSNGGTKTLAGNIIVNGSFIINGSILDASASNFSITLNGGIFKAVNAGSFVPRSGTVTLSGGDNISLDGVASSTLNFYNLVINKTLATDQTILNNPATVSNTLTLTKGELFLQNGDLTLTNATPANQILPATPTSASYVATVNNGRALVRQNLAGAGTYTFPVGNATQYQPFVITNPSPTVSVRFGTPTATVPTSGVGSWFVSNGSATTSTVRFNNPQGGTLLTGISAVGKYGSSWVAMSGTTYPTATDYSVLNNFTGGTVEFGILTTNAFRTTWRTTVASETITIPVFTGLTYTCTVDWGDGSSNTYNAVSPAISHVYATAGTYTVSIVGTFPRIFFNNGGDRTKIKTIEQWGNIAWTSMDAAFWGCNTLTYNATDIPNFSVGGFSCQRMFMDCSLFNGNATMNTWNTANVINMSYMFTSAGAFNQPIGNWNTSAVTNMAYMFNSAGTFNQNIGTWNTGAVMNMTYMFSGASAFNQNIGSWNTIAATNMNNMFAYCPFNQNIGSWNVINVINMGGMFVGNSSFNQNLGTWTLKTGLNSVNMGGMLDNTGMSTTNYDATLIGWSSQSLTNITLGANGLTYCASSVARGILTGTKTWTISGDINGCPSFNAVTATNVTATSFTANWTAFSGAVSYRIDVSTVSNFASFVTGYNNLNVGNVGTYNVTGLTPNTVYYYQVKAYNAVPTLLSTSTSKMTSTILPAGSGNGLNGDGSTRYVNVDNGLSSIEGRNTGTVMGWFKATGTGSQVLFSLTRGDNITDYMQIGLNNLTSGTESIWFDITRTSVTVNRMRVLDGVGNLTDGKWHHFAVVINGTANAIYIDGVAKTVAFGPGSATTSEFSNIDSQSAMRIGNRRILNTEQNYLNGQADEFSIWNRSFTPAEVRDMMCRKMVGNENNLLAYFRLDEGTGTITENKAYAATFDGTVAGASAWATSGAPLGDVSVNTYGGSSLTLTNTDVMTANSFTGAPAGVHLYKVNAAPNTTTPPSNYASLYTDRYWGIFFAGGTAPKANLAYNYSANNTVDVANALRFAQRDNNADNTWVSAGGVVQRLLRRLSHSKKSAGEYILAERNTIIANFKDGGTVHSFVAASSQHTALAGRYVQNDFTIEFWLRTTQTGTGTAGQWETGTGLVTANGAGNNDFGITLIGNRVAFGTGIAANTVQSDIATNISNGKWYHIAATRAGGNISLYVNGTLQGNTLATGFTNTLNAAAAIHIGKLVTGGNFFTGSIDELRIWSVALSANTIKDWINLRTYDEHPNFLNLEAYHRFDENTGIFSEELVNGNDATMFNGVTWGDANMPLGDGQVSREIVPATPNNITVFSEAGVTMEFGNLTTPNGEVVVTRIDGEPENYPAVAGMSFMNCYWVVRNYGTNQTFSPLTEIKFEVPAGNTISAADLANPNNIKLYKRPDDAVGSTIGVGNWEGVAQATGFGSIRFRQSIGGSDPTTVDDFSQFVIGSTSSPLPITLLGLKGIRVEGQKGEMTEEVKLEWSTASEINNKGFEVEMSQEGRNYEKIAFTEGKGTSNTPINYQLTTINPKEGYYRLKQIDFDGTFSYSPIVFVAGMVGKDFVIVYPNPAQSNLKLKVSESILPTDLLKAEVYSMAGKRIWRGAGKLEELQASLQQVFPSWKAGTYILQIRTDKKRVETKFIKE